MDHSAEPMHVIKTNQALSREFPDQREWDSLVVVPLDDFKEIHSKDFKHHHEVLSIWTVVNEAVQQLGTVRSISSHACSFKFGFELWIIRVEISDRLLPFICLPIVGHLVKNLNLVIGSFQVVLG